MIEAVPAVAETRYERKLRQTREWRARNRERVRFLNQKWALEHPGQNTENTRAWRKRNPERSTEAIRAYAKKNAARIAVYQRAYRQKNKTALYQRAREYAAARYKSDPWFRVRENLRNRINEAITEQGWTKRSRTGDLIGCSWEHLKAHIESQFQSGMTWENYGEWHVDHRTPCKAFRLCELEEQRLCMNWQNLQPLWAADNLQKGAKMQTCDAATLCS
jgi:hypothetical protein